MRYVCTTIAQEFSRTTVHETEPSTCMDKVDQGSEKIVGDLEEKIRRQNDPDDQFDGTTSGIFDPLEYDTRTPLIPLLEEKKPTQHKQKVEKSGSSPTNNDASSNTRMSVHTKERVESEQTEPERRQKERSIIQVNEGVQRHVHPEEKRLIDYPCIHNLNKRS